MIELGRLRTLCRRKADLFVKPISELSPNAKHRVGIDKYLEFCIPHSGKR